MMLGYSYTADYYQTKVNGILNGVLEQLKESEKSKDMFIAAMSHEFRNPLNSMLLSIDIIKTDNADGLT